MVDEIIVSVIEIEIGRALLKTPERSYANLSDEQYDYIISSIALEVIVAYLSNAVSC